VLLPLFLFFDFAEEKKKKKRFETKCANDYGVDIIQR